MTDQSSRSDVHGNEVAIIGMAGRFPGASTIEAYWHNLVNGIEGIERFGRETNGTAASASAVSHEVKAAARLNAIDLFDAEFFGFSPKEAELMDPQHRLFLECVHEALERAGYDPERFPGLIGVYGGMGGSSYFRHVLETIGRQDGALGLQLVLGNDKDYLTTMVSYKLNLRGPSIAVQTACSTSLVAVHVACQSLLDYECDIALAGGVSIRAPQPLAYRYYEGGILSPDGYCRAFDARAQGTVFGNGLGVVALRRLADAQADGDRICAVILGSAVNNDGAAKVGYTAPAVRGQVEMVQAALARAGVDPASIQYVEAHGTGTPLGDPIEVKALTEAYRAKTDAIGYCGLGSVKTNIGHLDAAAGVAGLIKTVLALSHRTLPPTLHFHEPNPETSLDNSPFYVVTDATPWDGAQPRRAAVSSLGIGGTNAHVVLEEAPAIEPVASERSHHVLVLSARSSDALDAATVGLAAHLKAHADLGLADAAYTLQVGRRLFPHRRIAVCATVAEASEALDESDARVSTGFHEGSPPAVAFMFPGGGAHHVNMAAGLYRTETVFRAQVETCLDLLRPLVAFNLKDVLYPSAAREAKASKDLQQTSFALPALFIVEYALAKLWMAWGVRPHALIGHSLGEYVAACLAGVLSLPDALALVVRRSQLLDRIVPGSMISVPLSEHDLQPLLGADLALAAINAPSLCVVSGSIAAIARATTTLAARGVDVRPLHIAVGAHSPLVEPMLDTFRAFVATLSLRPPEIPFVSNVSGTWITSEQATSADYWADHLRQTVRFADGVGELLKESGVLLEVGPGRTLSTLAKAHPDSGGTLVMSSLPHPYDADPDARVLFGALGQLWLAGAEIDWDAHHGPVHPRRVLLPTYPFERQRFWIGPDESRPDTASVERQRTSIDRWIHVPVWKQSPPGAALPRRPVPDGPGAWLIFSDSAGFGDLLAHRLEASGDHVVRVAAGEDFAQPGPRTFVLNPERPADYDRLFRSLERDRLPHTIVHLWNMSTDAARRRPICPSLGDSSPFDQLLQIGQAAQGNGVTKFHLAVCANGLAHVLPGDELCPGKALLIGACRVMPQEHLGVTSRWIDLALPKASRKVERLADLLIDELRCASSAQAVAYRGKQRWVQTFDRIALRADTPSPLRPDGVYLITGGFGGLGSILARHLAATCHARLVLVGRTALPPREAWDAWLASHPESDDTSAAIRMIADLEASGAEVLTIAADVCNPADVDRMLGEACRRFGLIHGVFHLAGVPGGGVMHLKTPSMAAAVCAPKVQGTHYVLEACRGRRLDFLALFSSITAVTGGVGQSDHCAASAFMDAVATAWSERGDLRVVAIDWDAWESARQQDATLSQLPHLKQQFERWRAQFGIRPEEGMDVLSRVLGSGLSRVIVSTQDLQLSMDAHDCTLTAATRQGSEAVRPARPRPRGVVYVAPRSITETRIAAVWQSILGVDAVGMHDNVFALGAHSLLILQVVAKLRQDFGTEVPVRAVFEQPTIAQLAVFIDALQQAPRSEATGEDDELARVLREVERLTPEQVRDQLITLESEAPAGGTV